MDITEVKIFLRNEEKLKAFVTVTLDGQLALHNAKIIQTEKGPILCMPARKGQDGVYRDIVHPINTEFRKKLEAAVLSRYQEEISRLASQSAHPHVPKPLETAVK